MKYQHGIAETLFEIGKRISGTHPPRQYQHNQSKKAPGVAPPTRIPTTPKSIKQYGGVTSTFLRVPLHSLPQQQ